MIVGEGSLNIGKQKIQFLINESGCWLCQGRHLDKDGYAQIYYKGSITRVHRAVYQFFHKTILAPDVFVCHECDDPQCTNPDHLVAGSNMDNVQAKVNRGRQLKGEQVPGSKLTENSVLEILNNKDKTTKELAQKFNVNPSAIRKVLNGKTWVYVAPSIERKKPRKIMKRIPNKPLVNSYGMQCCRPKRKRASE